ncbi:MAG TPA: SUMF1/EgtB/PvdO family nonheme iron enzyme, partial [Nitrospirota bacterium]|nr:SUMF1/EgtB/PvdO family nonheme iron enzyme [Nitrospirota bacterium]
MVIPDVTLLNQDGKRISLRSLLDPGRPVVIDFISTRCRVICPVLSHGFSDLQRGRGAAPDPVQLVSISTDPDSDGPDQMKEYLAKYTAGTGWDFLTGNRSDIVRVMKALDITAGNALSPLPFYFLRGPNSDEWVRIEGKSGASALLREIRRMEDEAKESLAPGAIRKEEPKGLSADRSPLAANQLVPIKGGCFRMGDPSGSGHEYVKPVHEVCVDDFSLGKYDVTVGEFKQFVDDTGYRTEAEKGGGCYGWTGSKWKKKKSMTWRNAGFTQDDRHPVVCVSWNDAEAFAGWLSAKTGKKYRLP